MSRSPSPLVKRLPVTGMASMKVFWIRPANPELDRSGDWLLKHLTTTRARLMSRAGPA
jgi:hypothetical protein